MTSVLWPVAVLRFRAVSKCRTVLLEAPLPCGSHTIAEPSVPSYLGLARVTACKRGARPGDGDVSSVGVPLSSVESVWAALSRTMPSISSRRFSILSVEASLGRSGIRGCRKEV